MSLTKVADSRHDPVVGQIGERMIAAQAAHILKENQALAMRAMKGFHQNLTRAKTGAESFRRKETVNIKPMAQMQYYNGRIGGTRRRTVGRISLARLRIL